MQMVSSISALAAAIALAAGLGVSVPAFAAGTQFGPGVTSGPATHTPTVPNTAIYNTPKTAPTHTAMAGAATGDAGVPAKTGVEAGRQPQHQMNMPGHHTPSQQP